MFSFDEMAFPFLILLGLGIAAFYAYDQVIPHFRAMQKCLKYQEHLLSLNQAQLESEFSSGKLPKAGLQQFRRESIDGTSMKRAFDRGSDYLDYLEFVCVRAHRGQDTRQKNSAAEIQLTQIKGWQVALFYLLYGAGFGFCFAFSVYFGNYWFFSGTALYAGYVVSRAKRELRLHRNDQFLLAALGEAERKKELSFRRTEVYERVYSDSARAGLIDEYEYRTRPLFRPGWSETPSSSSSSSSPSGASYMIGDRIPDDAERYAKYGFYMHEVERTGGP